MPIPVLQSLSFQPIINKLRQVKSINLNIILDFCATVFINNKRKLLQKVMIRKLILIHQSLWSYVQHFMELIITTKYYRKMIYNYAQNHLKCRGIWFDDFILRNRGVVH